MGALFDRLVAGDGAVRDGPRRYLLMRPDVLMGTFARLHGQARRAALDALAASAEANAADSLRAYLASLGGDREALLATTAAAAADLGWGRWNLRARADRIWLDVDNSPFACCHPERSEGSRPPPEPTCAPIRGLLAALAAIVLDAKVEARELRCAACGAPRCELVAERRP